MSREYPDRPFVGVGVVVWRGDNVLLIQRGKPPRIGACCAVAGKVLYVLGGTLEVGDTKELALDDVWCRDARKKDAPWTRLVSGTMSKRSAHWAAEESDKSDDEDEEDLGSTSSDSDETAGEEEEVKRDQWTR